MGEVAGHHRPARPRRAGPGLPDSLDQPQTWDAAREVALPSQGPAAEMHPAFRQRLKAARRARLAGLGRWALALGIPALLVVLLVASPVAAVRQGDIKIEGLGGAAKPAEVSAVLAPYVGVPLIRLNLRQITEQLEALPGIKQASVARSWPTGLSVSLVPRVAAAVVKDGPEFVLLDAEGEHLERVAQAPDGLPLVVVPLDQSNSRALRSLLDVVAALPPDLASQVEQASATSQDGVTLKLTAEVTILWGDASEPALKAAAAGLLIEHGATWIDVTAPEMPVTKEPAR